MPVFITISNIFRLDSICNILLFISVCDVLLVFFTLLLVDTSLCNNNIILFFQLYVFSKKYVNDGSTKKLTNNELQILVALFSLSVCSRSQINFSCNCAWSSIRCIFYSKIKTVILIISENFKEIIKILTAII